MMYLIPIQAVAADHQVLPTEQVPRGLSLCNELLFGVSRYKSSALLRAWFCFLRPSVLPRTPRMWSQGTAGPADCPDDFHCREA